MVDRCGAGPDSGALFMSGWREEWSVASISGADWIVSLAVGWRGVVELAATAVWEDRGAISTTGRAVVLARVEGVVCQSRWASLALLSEIPSL